MPSASVHNESQIAIGFFFFAASDGSVPNPNVSRSGNLMRLAREPERVALRGSADAAFLASERERERSRPSLA